MSKLIGQLACQKYLPYRKIKIFTALCTNTMNTFEVVQENKFNPHVYRCYCSERKDSSKITKVNPAEIGTPKTLKKASYLGLILAGVVKQTTEAASYLGIILAGVGVTAVICYKVFCELFSSKNSNSVYTTSLKKCCADPRVIDSLGEPVKAFRDEIRRASMRRVRKGITVLDHPPYSPDLATGDFWLFPKVKLAMKGDRHDTIQDIQRESTAVLNANPQKGVQ
ncbi:hypothetical protein B7P43_G11195 [Cryptotermes secundus]|uniref:Mitochondrial import inner membrane translocase subunit Tim21 n=1 Tax=Cryptotermes secundus TaxID=105785 RepID=A0A2J7QMF9_9NEOP|nr:hypothetical protein B7P43_G11195 [Cryptotermes secundus]